MNTSALLAAYNAALNGINPSVKAGKPASVEYTMAEYAASERGKAMLANETAEMQLLATLGVGTVQTSANITVAPTADDHTKDLWSVDFDTLSKTAYSNGKKVFERKVVSALQCKHSNVAFWGVPARPADKRGDTDKFPQPKVFYTTAVAFTSTKGTLLSFASATACELFEDAVAPVMDLYRAKGAKVTASETILTYETCEEYIKNACLNAAGILKINKDLSFNVDANKKQFRLVVVRRIDTTENNVAKLDLNTKTAF